MSVEKLHELLKSQPSLWLNRPLGPWADELIRWCDGRCTINLVAHIVTNNDHTIDIDLFKQAVFGLVYNEPHLRTDADLTVTPALWVPATDFSDLFRFKDLREEGIKSVKEAWSHVEGEANSTWQFGSGKPLYRCTLLRIHGGYIVMNIYHHAAADGTSGMLMMGGIMEQYRRLEQGGEVLENPHKPRGPMEEMVEEAIGEGADDVVKEMMKKKVKKAKEYQPMLPFDMEEHENNKAGEFINKILFRDGTKENYKGIRARCKTEGVSVGSLALAASYMAMAQVHANTSCPDNTAAYTGMKDQYMDIPVNIRHRLDNVKGDEYCGFYVTEVTFNCDVMLETRLWDLARNIQGQLKVMMDQDQHLLFARAKEEWETGPTKDLAVSSWQEGKISDVIVSNLMYYKYPTDVGWGTIRALYCAVSVAIPFCSNLEMLFQACSDMFTYTLVYCPGKNNEESANKWLDSFVNIMENSHENSGLQSLKEYLSNQ